MSSDERTVRVRVAEATEHFAKWCWSHAADGMDLDGGSVQDKLEDLGLIVKIPGGFDPERDCDGTGCAEPGCDWYVWHDSDRLLPLPTAPTVEAEVQP